VPSDFYELALRRIQRLTIAIGAIVPLVALPLRGRAFALGLLAGATLSYFNFTWLKSLAEALGDAGRTPLRGSAVFLVLRYGIAAGAIYVIVTFTGIALGAVLIGLLANIAAVLLEILYELVFLKNQ